MSKDKYARTCRGCRRHIRQGAKHFELTLIESWKGNKGAYEQTEDPKARGYFCSPGCVINFVAALKVLKKFMHGEG